MRVDVIKPDGTADLFGNALSVSYDGETNSVTVCMTDESGRTRRKVYMSGQHIGVELTSNLPGIFDMYPTDSEVIP